MAKGKGGNGLMRAALKFLKKADFQRNKRARPHRLEPHQLKHVLWGNANSVRYNGLRSGSGKYGTRVGYHSRPGGQDMPGRRILPPPTKTHSSGAYQVRTQFQVDTRTPKQIKDGEPPQLEWKDKSGKGGVSTFFPDHWTPQRIDGEISGAFKNGTKNPDGTWSGMGSDGLPIEGRWDTQSGGIMTAYPEIPNN
jgi:hypothetical protein